MISNKIIAVVGGDLRQAHLANTLAAKENGCEVYAMFMNQDVKLAANVQRSHDIMRVLPQSDMVIFPLPMLDADGNINTVLSDRSVTLEQCLDAILPGAIVFAGMIPKAAYDMASARNIQLIDYYNREEFAVMNAVSMALAKRE